MPQLINIGSCGLHIVHGAFRIGATATCSIGQFLKEIQKHREQEELPQLINIDSCGLHIVQGAFQTGATTTCWNVKGTLKAIYKLLHESPARCADYISVT